MPGHLTRRLQPFPGEELFEQLLLPGEGRTGADIWTFITTRSETAGGPRNEMYPTSPPQDHPTPYHVKVVLT